MPRLDSTVGRCSRASSKAMSGARNVACAVCAVSSSDTRLPSTARTKMLASRTMARDVTGSSLLAPRGRFALGLEVRHQRTAVVQRAMVIWKGQRGRAAAPARSASGPTGRAEAIDVGQPRCRNRCGDAARPTQAPSASRLGRSRRAADRQGVQAVKLHARHGVGGARMDCPRVKVWTMVIA